MALAKKTLFGIFLNLSALSLNLKTIFSLCGIYCKLKLFGIIWLEIGVTGPFVPGKPNIFMLALYDSIL